jgi:hypothetical protein
VDLLVAIEHATGDVEMAKCGSMRGRDGGRKLAAGHGRKSRSWLASHKRIGWFLVEWDVAPDHRNNEKDKITEIIMANKRSANQKSGRTLNRTTGKSVATKKAMSRTTVAGAPFNEQDPKRRLGNFTSAGEHARQGGRTSGIVGQKKQRNKTDK